MAAGPKIRALRRSVACFDTVPAPLFFWYMSAPVPSFQDTEGAT